MPPISSLPPFMVCGAVDRCATMSRLGVNTLGMERGFLSQKGSGVGSGVKEKQVSIADKSVEVSKQANVVNTGLKLFPAISKVHGIHSPASNEENINDVGTTVGPTLAGNTPGMSSYANVTGVPKSIRAIIERFANTAYGFFLGKRVAYLVVANYVRNTWGKYGLVKSMLNSFTEIFSFQFSLIEGLDAMLENGLWFTRNNPLILKKWNLDVNLLKEDVGNVPVWVKLHGVPVTAFSENSLSVISTKIGTPLMLDSYTFDICIQSWGRSSYARALIEVQADVELKDNIMVAMPKLDGGGVLYNNISTSSNKKNDVEPTKEVNSSSTSTTHIVEKINKIQRLVIDGMAILVGDEGKLLTRVYSSGDHDSEDEVASVDNDTANFLASKDVGYGTNSVLEQMKESYENREYDYDPNDDDMYEGQDIPDKIQDICDNLDIKVRS
ncbi:putative reverse transcriptase domain-containing protein [Tanacetum coccineum]